MYLTVVHHPKAGRGEYSGARLRKALKDAGHRVLYLKKNRDDWKKELAGDHEVVVAAGGDGTVDTVARRLVGRKIPLAVLPLGTANNLARTLGFNAPVEELIANLESTKPRAFDVGIACGPWGRRVLFEGVGGGLLADYMTDPCRKKPRSRREELRAHATALRDLLQSYKARRWKVFLDGEPLRDRYLFFEALNVAFVGPGLRLAPDARTNDGCFDLVLARESERELVIDYLAARIANGRETPFPLSARRFRRLRMQGPKTRLHLDGKLQPRRQVPVSERLDLRLEVQPDALPVLSNR